MRSWRYMVINDGVVEKWWQTGINNEGLDDDTYFESTLKMLLTIYEIISPYIDKGLTLLYNENN